MIKWGPNMEELLSRLDRAEIPYRPLSPAEFAACMDQLCGTRVDRENTPEQCAQEWLAAFDGKVITNG